MRAPLPVQLASVNRRNGFVSAATSAYISPPGKHRDTDRVVRSSPIHHNQVFIMRRTTRIACLLSISCLLCPACSDDEASGGSDAEIDDEGSDQPVQDSDADVDAAPVDGEDQPVQDADVDAAPDGDEDVLLTELPIRIPQTRQVPGVDWQGLTFYREYPDMDALCQFRYGDIDGLFYLQATPVSLNALQMPEFDDASTRGWVQNGGTVTEVDTVYNWGGRHHLDWFTLVYRDVGYRYSHSSIGSGVRTCGSPDCLIVCREGTSCESTDEVAEDGCYRPNPVDGVSAPAPSLPRDCVWINADGTVPPFEDRWDLPAESQRTPLPCSGDDGSMHW
jgi:hypothetical protein